MTIKIDKRKAKSLLRQAVKKRGADTVVLSCSYIEEFDEGSDPISGCLVGEALYLAGISIEGLNLLDTEVGNIDGITPDKAEEAGFSLTPGAQAVFSRAQAIQDGRWSTCDDACPQNWGTALEKALEV